MYINKKQIDFILFGKIPLFSIHTLITENEPKEDTMEFIETQLNEDDDN